jgi:hypothetical protein
MTKQKPAKIEDITHHMIEVTIYKPRKEIKILKPWSFT